jgi:hypothetical protein
LGVNLDRIRIERADFLNRALGYEAGETGQALRSAERQQVFVQDLIRGGSGWASRDDVWLRRGRRVVDAVQCGNQLGALAAVMAGIASQQALACEVFLIDFIDHAHHLARRFLHGSFFGEPSPIADAVRTVAKLTSDAQRRGEKAHGVHELIFGNPFEELEIFVDLAGHEYGTQWRGRMRLRGSSGLAVT